MPEKTVVDVPMTIDEAMLSPRGWQVKDARARLTSSEADLTGSTSQSLSLSVSVSLKLTDGGRLSRYTGFDWRLSPVIVEVSCPRLGESTYVQLLSVGEAKRLRNGFVVQTAESGAIAYNALQLDIADLKLTVTSVDGGELPTSIEPLVVPTRDLAFAVVDERFELDGAGSSVRGRAFAARHGLVVVVSGETEVMTYGRLVEVTARRHSGTDLGEFDVQLPDIELDILDDTDFLLHRRSVRHSLKVSGKSPDDVPQTPARWIDYVDIGGDDFAGAPTKVVARLVDG